MGEVAKSEYNTSDFAKAVGALIYRVSESDIANKADLVTRLRAGAEKFLNEFSHGQFFPSADLSEVVVDIQLASKVDSIVDKYIKDVFRPIHNALHRQIESRPKNPSIPAGVMRS